MPSAKHELLYPSKPKPSPQAVPPSVIEGGFINDRSGEATKRLRKHFGIAVKPSTGRLPPGSRVVGENNLALGESAIDNLPADPEDMQVVSPMLKETDAQRMKRTRNLQET